MDELVRNTYRHGDRVEQTAHRQSKTTVIIDKVHTQVLLNLCTKCSDLRIKTHL